MILPFSISAVVLVSQQAYPKKPQLKIVHTHLVNRIMEKYWNRDGDIFDIVFPESPNNEPSNFDWKLRVQMNDEQFILYRKTKRDSLIPVYHYSCHIWSLPSDSSLPKQLEMLLRADVNASTKLIKTRVVVKHEVIDSDNVPLLSKWGNRFSDCKLSFPMGTANDGNSYNISFYRGSRLVLSSKIHTSDMPELENLISDFRSMIKK